MKKCTLGNRHKWKFIKNLEITRVSTHTASFHLKGLYQCECGAKKYGEHQ